MSGSAARKAAVVASVLVAVLVGPAAGRAAAQTIWISVTSGDDKVAGAKVTVAPPRGDDVAAAFDRGTQLYFLKYRGAGTYRFTVVARGHTFDPQSEKIPVLRKGEDTFSVHIRERLAGGRAAQPGAARSGGAQDVPPPQGSRGADSGPGASRGPTSPAGRNEAAPSRTPPPPVPEPAPAGQPAGGERATPQESPSEQVPDAPTQAEPEPVTTVDREQTDDARNLGRGQRVSITVVPPSSGSLAWIVAGGFALLAVAFQALALVRGQPRRGGGRDHGVATRLAELSQAVARLRHSADAGVRQWKHAETLATEARMTAESAMPVPVAQWPDDDDRASRPSTDQTIVRRAPAVPTSMPVETYMPVEVSSPVAAAAPPAPRSLMADYTRARQSSNHAKAASEFEGQYACTRLSLVNSDEVRANPKVLPEFEVAGRGFFIAVDEGGQWKCFPWFTTSLAEESFRSVFDFRGAEASRLTQPARLDRRGDKWVLAVRGQIDSNA